MKYRIATDARPQVNALLIAGALSIALWFIPYAEYLVYPFRIFVTFIHEGGHALAALVTGGSVHSLAVMPSGRGEVYSATGGLLSQMIVSSAGYLGAMTFGALLLLLIRRRVAPRFVLLGSAALILTLTVVFGFLAPSWTLISSGSSTAPALSDFFFTLAAGVLLPVGLFAAARYLSARAAAFLVSFLAVQCILNAVFDLRNILFISAFTDMNSDALNMYKATGVHSIIWALMWAVVGFVILSLAMRAYSVAREKPSQPDLPFEDDPLEV